MKHFSLTLNCFAKPFILSLCCLFTSHLFSQTIDSSFAVNGKLGLPVGQDGNDIFYSGSILFQDDKILVSEWDEDDFQYYAATQIFRLTKNGKIDSTFGGGEVYINSLKGAHIAVQNDKKILAAGDLSEHDNPDLLGTVAVYRFLPSGKPDLNFGVKGKFSILLSSGSSFSAVAQKDNGKILAAGPLSTRNNSAGITVIQLNKNGSLDSNFGTKGFIYKTSPYEGTCYDFKILPDQKILAGFIYTIENKVIGTSIIRYKTTGAIDSSFGVNGVVLVGNRDTKQHGGLPVSISLASNDKFIVYTADSSEQGVLCRYTKLGKPDLSFGVNGRVAISSQNHAYHFFVTTDSSNRILLNQTVSKGVISVARFKTNGTIDNSFGVNGVIPMDTIADAILVAPDNKLIVYGIFGVPVVMRYKFDNVNALKNDAVSATTKQNSSENIVVYPNPSTNIFTYLRIEK